MTAEMKMFNILGILQENLEHWMCGCLKYKAGKMEFPALLKLLIYEELQQMLQLFWFLFCNCSYLAAEVLLYGRLKWSYWSIWLLWT